MDDTGLEYSLRNENSSKAIAKLYLNADLADVNFVFAQDDEIVNVPANKAILAAMSPVFYVMFFGDMKEKGDVSITDTLVDAFKEFLQFFYLSEPRLTMTNMREVVKLADKYDILSCVVDSAEDFINRLTLENVCWALQLAIIIENEPLGKASKCYIEVFTKDILESTTFGHCDHEVLMVILQMEELAVTEIDILNASLKWAKNACERDGVDANVSSNLRQKLGNGFQLIRFGAIDAETFSINCADVYEKMFTHEELIDFFKSFTNPNHNLTEFRSDQRREPRYSINFVSIRYNFRRYVDSHTLKENYETYFTTNYPVILRAIGTRRIRVSNGVMAISLSMSLYELENPSFEESVESKKVWERTNMGTKSMKEIFCPIFPINPRKMYKICLRVRCSGDRGGYLYHPSYSSHSVNKLDDRLPVTFHKRSPTITWEEVHDDIFSSLQFSYLNEPVELMHISSSTESIED